MLHSDLQTDGIASLQPQASNEEPREVIWQSAFWMLTALALNAMLQKSMADRFLPSKTLSWARSSPVIASADVIITFVWAITGWTHGVAFWPAFSLAYHHHLGLGAENLKDLSPDVVSAGITLFVLGPLPQAVKLFGLGNVTLTWILGLSYVSAYLVSILNIFGTPTNRNPRMMTSQLNTDTISLLRTISDSITGIAIALQVSLWLYIFVTLASRLMNPVQPIFVAVLVLFLTGYFLIFTTGFSYKSLLGCLLIAPIIYLLIEINHHSDNINDIPGYLYLPFFYVGHVLMSIFFLGFGFGSCTILLALISKVSSSISGRVRGRAKMNASLQIRFSEEDTDFVPMAFAIGNLVFGLAYYRYIYDPSGTSKPAWTEMLG